MRDIHRERTHIFVRTFLITIIAVIAGTIVVAPRDASGGVPGGDAVAQSR